MHDGAVVILAQCLYTKMRKEYLNTVLYNTSVLLWIKTEQFDI